MILGRELPNYPYNLKAILTRCLVKGRRELFGGPLSRWSSHAPLPVCAKGQAANDLVASLLAADSPCLISRFGSGEMETTLRGIDVSRNCSLLKKIGLMLIGESGPFWWDNSIRAGIVWSGGYFPETDDALNAFSDRVCEDARELDLIGSWLPGEKYIMSHFNPSLRSIPINDLEPFTFKSPWTGVLKGKKVLAVHPFADTIPSQYAKRRHLFKNPDMLPDFELTTYRTISSFAGNKTPYATWFDALEKMCGDIAKFDFDIALIGCGAYGMSIGAFIKRELKRKAVHLGGMTQLLFGIKGRRWEGIPKYDALFNEHWVRPFESDTITAAKTIENGCYW